MSNGKPLSGYCVVEIGHSVAGPYTGLILAELGADVIKVESPKNGGDYARGWGPPFLDGVAPHFLALNRGKRSITVDLDDIGQREALERLILETADVVVTNLRAGVAEAKGLGSKRLCALKPSLVYCEIGAFGSGGPLSDRPGYDPLMQAYGGLMSITGEDCSRPPIRVGVPIIDMGAGLWAAIGILGELLDREKTGKGASVETSLLETALAWTSIPIASIVMQPRRMGPHGSGAAGIVPYQAFHASDGWIVIAAGNDNLFQKLASALKLPELASDPRFTTNAERVRNREALVAILDSEVSTRPIAEIRSLLDVCGVPNAPVQRVDEVICDPQVLSLGIIQQGPAEALPTVGLPLRFNGERPAYVRRAPQLGEHTVEVLQGLSKDASGTA